MSATVYFQEFNGAAGTPTAKHSESIRFKSADSPVPDTLDKLIRPGGGVFRSYEKYLRPRLEALGGSASISNVEMFTTDVSPDAGFAVYAKTAAAYAVPLAGGYEAAGEMVGPKGSLFSYTASNPLTLGAGPFAAPGDIGDFAVLQAEVYPSADVTATPNYSLVLRYDEAV